LYVIFTWSRSSQDLKFGNPGDYKLLNVGAGKVRRRSRISRIKWTSLDDMRLRLKNLIAIHIKILKMAKTPFLLRLMMLFLMTILSDHARI
jgi:hypothetical protein